MGDYFIINLAGWLAFLAVIIEDISGWHVLNFSKVVSIARCDINSKQYNLTLEYRSLDSLHTIPYNIRLPANDGPFGIILWF